MTVPSCSACPAGPSSRRRGATRWRTSPSGASASPCSTSAATAAAPRRPRSSATPSASSPATSPRSSPRSTTGRSCSSATTGGHRSCGTRRSATPTASVRSPGSASPTPRRCRCRCSICSTSSTPTASSTCCASSEPGVIEAEFARRPARRAQARLLRAVGRRAARTAWLPDAPRDSAFLPLLPDPPVGPLELHLRRRARRDGGDVRAHRDDRRVQPLPRRRVRRGDRRRHRRSHRHQPSCFIAGARDPVTRDAPGCRQLRRSGRGVHRLPRQHDRRRRRPLGPAGGAVPRSTPRSTPSSPPSEPARRRQLNASSSCRGGFASPCAGSARTRPS